MRGSSVAIKTRELRLVFVKPETEMKLSLQKPCSMERDNSISHPREMIDERREENLQLLRSALFQGIGCRRDREVTAKSMKA